MSFADSSSPYDILEVPPDATPQEIRAAYLRAKTAYKKDSVALYSLLSEEETHDILTKIEEAYLVLSTPERRRDYDRLHGELSGPPSEASPAVSPVVSIDRVPPMEIGASEDELLVPPATDFPMAPEAKIAPSVIPPPPPTGISFHRTIGTATSAADELAQSIARETEWKGAFLKRVREQRRISLEELAEFTKINKNYLSAIEDEQFGRLPASVFVRGFIGQIARALKIPPEKVVPAFMARYSQAREGR
jgi:curved DNA-binding protein CbpA